MGLSRLTTHRKTYFIDHNTCQPCYSRNEYFSFISYWDPIHVFITLTSSKMEYAPLRWYINICPNLYCCHWALPSHMCYMASVLIILLTCFNWQSFAELDRKQQCCPLISHHSGSNVFFSGQSPSFQLGSLHPLATHGKNISIHFTRRMAIEQSIYTFFVSPTHPSLLNLI